jgi:hypothetical protein
VSGRDAYRASCEARGAVHQTNEIAGGTGQFAVAAGDFTATVTGRRLLPRNRDGSCDSTRDPMHEVDMITATGTLSF